MNVRHALCLGAFALAGCQGSAAVPDKLLEPVTRPSFSCNGYPRANTDGTWTVCDLRTFANLAATGAASMRADSGSLIAGGGDRTALTLRAYVYATSDNQADAQALAAQVAVHTDNNDFYASGPQVQSPQSWTADLDADLPTQTNLTASSANGTVYVDLLDGNISLGSDNGGVSVKGLAGNVTLGAVNGSIAVDLSGAKWSGAGLNAQSTNGSVSFVADSGYSAHFSFDTVNGTVSSNMGTCTPSQDFGPQSCDFTTGSGGATLSGSTTNGDVSLQQRTVRQL